VVVSRIVGWQFLMGVWLYGLVADVSYSIQIRERANASERRALRAEAALVEARLEALRNRLNPHFLFNALHTVGALVRQDAARAENAVERLGDLLRPLRDDPAKRSRFTTSGVHERYLEFSSSATGGCALAGHQRFGIAPSSFAADARRNAVRHPSQPRRGRPRGSTHERPFGCGSG
jgi:hypothetical protein